MPGPAEALEHERPSRATARETALLVLVTLLCLVPFVDKAFHIDDPLFLWTARHIQSHPLDFYGFRVNWYEFGAPLSALAPNPPGAAYYLALAASVVGWGERGLHLAFLLPAVGAVLGTYAVARRCCSHPLVATLASTLTPAFVVSSTSLMSDTLFLALWVWAVLLWMDGLERERHGLLLAAGLLVAAATLTKYYGAGLVPLLGAHALARRRRADWPMLWLLVPVTVLAAYQWATARLYGRGLFSHAVSYASGFRVRSGALLVPDVVMALAFVGGSLATVAFFAPLCWSRRALAIGGLLGVLGTLGLPYLGAIGVVPLNDEHGVRWLLLLQVALFALAGAVVLALAAADLRRRRDASSLLLGLWILGTVLFAGSLNWTINARSLLPMAPAVGILLARRLEGRGHLAPEASRWRVWAPLAAGAALSLLVGWADQSLAGTARGAAASIAARFAGEPGARWFQGHWGFQHYMEAAGWKPVDVEGPRVARGDLMVLPLNNTNLFPPAEALAFLEWAIEIPALPFLATMSTPVGAGFYTGLWGPLPFAAGAVPPERYLVLRLRADLPAQARQR